MKLLLIFSVILGFTWNSQASRLIEVEDYYSKKASDFIKTRYPRKAFSVYVKVDAEEKPEVRQPAGFSQQKTLNLPYFDRVNSQEVSFWDRKDVSLGTLISYLKSVFIKIDIDGHFANEEMQKFKAELFQHLKLSEVYDRVEVNKRQWQSPSSWRQNQPLVVAGFALLLVLAGLFFVIFQTGVSRLVKGLSQPLSEIGKSAENVANSSGLSGDSGHQSSFQLANQRWEDGGLSADHEEKAKKEIARLSNFLSDPNGELIQKIEELGNVDPFAMGAIFSEMEIADLQNLIQWARGDWWRVAITQATPLSQRSLEFLGEFSHLYMRKNLLENLEDNEEKNGSFNRVLSRLSIKQFGELFENYKFEQAEKILRVLPQETMINVGKYLYPGRWAELLESKADLAEIDNKLMGQVEFKALTICPLKEETELSGYFRDADLLRFVDGADTKDERDVYRALGENSWIKKDRTPFFEIFNQSEEVMERLTTDLPLELWALAITSCDRDECEKLYKFFTAKQRFIMREFKARYAEAAPAAQDVVRAKKRILNSLVLIQSQLKIANQEPMSDMAA